MIVPRPSCIVDLKDGAIELRCRRCTEFCNIALPSEPEDVGQRMQDFCNYHRWCTRIVRTPDPG